MSDPQRGIRGFKIVFTVVGVIYAAMGASMVVRGVGALRPFGVPEDVIASPVMEDFFLFFYELMMVVGALMVLFGQVTVGRARQIAVSGVFTVLAVLAALRDLSTSDSRFGNRLYRGENTLVFVAISVTLALVFGTLVVLGLRGRSSATAPKSPTPA
ncbi:MAG: hypothetical protein U0414_44540 [Polyangiaceae bacterium]